jgi:tetratricopeptide (TPR) repeat protein
MSRAHSIRVLTLALCLFAGASRADVIHKTDGKTIEDVDILEETLQQIVFKKGKNESSVPSAEVLSVKFSQMPKMIDEAEAMLVEEDIFGALDNLDAYVDDQIEKRNERRKWAPAFAAWRAVELRIELADYEGIIEAANRLINHFPNSRYLPPAYLAMANAQVQSRKRTQAGQTLTALANLISSKSLSRRWDLECRLAQVQNDASKSGDKKREEILDVITAANAYPTVKNRASVAMGETYIEEAQGAIANTPKGAELREQAREIFQGIVDEFKADDETLAGAYSGLGDCLYYGGASDLDQDKLKEAVKHYLRVITVYRSQSRYVPRALFHAMRCFDLLEDPQRRNDMKRTLLTLYPDSSWASEAEKY